MPRIEVVVATYDRPRQLVRCIRALADQTTKDFGVLVVDDHSPTPQESVVDDGLKAELPVRFLRMESNGGPARARNRGVSESTADLIAFIDDDVVADPLLIERHLAVYEAGPANGVQMGPLAAPRDWHPTPWTLWEARTIATEYDKMVRGLYQPTWRQFFTGNAFLRREDFLAVGGFDETFTRAEDIEFAYRLAKQGATFQFVPDAVGWHYSERSKASWRRIARDYARFDIEIARRHPETRWLNFLEWERSRRNILNRIGSSLLAKLSAEPVGISTALTGADALYRVGATGPALKLLSFAYLLEYDSSFRQALARPA